MSAQRVPDNIWFVFLNLTCDFPGRQTPANKSILIAINEPTESHCFLLTHRCGRFHPRKHVFLTVFTQLQPVLKQTLERTLVNIAWLIQGYGSLAVTPHSDQAKNISNINSCQQFLSIPYRFYTKDDITAETRVHIRLLTNNTLSQSVFLRIPLSWKFSMS